jgi:hypothetical protein
MNIKIQPLGGLGLGGFNLTTTCDISLNAVSVNSCSQANTGDPIDWPVGSPIVLAVGDTLKITVIGGFIGVLSPPVQGCAEITGGSTTPSFTLNQTGPCVDITP